MAISGFEKKAETFSQPLDKNTIGIAGIPGTNDFVTCTASGEIKFFTCHDKGIEEAKESLKVDGSAESIAINAQKQLVCSYWNRKIEIGLDFACWDISADVRNAVKMTNHTSRVFRVPLEPKILVALPNGHFLFSIEGATYVNLSCLADLSNRQLVLPCNEDDDYDYEPVCSIMWDSENLLVTTSHRIYYVKVEDLLKTTGTYGVLPTYKEETYKDLALREISNFIKLPSGQFVFSFHDHSEGQDKHFCRVELWDLENRDSVPPVVLLSNLETGHQFSYTDDGKLLILKNDTLHVVPYLDLAFNPKRHAQIMEALSIGLTRDTSGVVCSYIAPTCRFHKPPPSPPPQLREIVKLPGRARGL